LLWLGEQGGDDPVVDRDHVEEDLISGLSLGDHLGRHRPGARKYRAPAKRQAGQTNKEGSKLHESARTLLPFFGRQLQNRRDGPKVLWSTRTRSAMCKSAVRG